MYIKNEMEQQVPKNYRCNELQQKKRPQRLENWAQSIWLLIEILAIYS
jgi:hypothetical protein